MSRPAKPWDQAYVEARVQVVPWTGCWLWLQQLDVCGYAQVRRGARTPWRKVHRLAYELWHGPVPKDLCVLHKCNVRACVNPAHLYAGTQLDNMADRRVVYHAEKRVGDLVKEVIVGNRRGSSILRVAARHGVGRLLLAREVRRSLDA